MTKFPSNLDFIPMPSEVTRQMAYRDKAGEITASRKRGLDLIRKYGKEPYKPSAKERGWIFYDTLVTTEKAEATYYFDLYLEKWQASYPWEICHWFRNWYQIWKVLRLHMHFKLPQDDAILFHTLARPFPPGFKPPYYKRQTNWSFEKLMKFLHTSYIKDKSGEVVKEIINNRSLLEKLLDGEVIPYKYTDVLTYSQLYSKITDYIIYHPEVAVTLKPGHQRAIENLRLHSSPQACIKAPWFLEAIRMHKAGVPEEELYRYLSEDAMST